MVEKSKSVFEIKLGNEDVFKEKIVMGGDLGKVQRIILHTI